MTTRDILMSAAGAGGKNYWAFSATDSATNTYAYGIDIDSSGNSYICGSFGNAEMLLMKVNSSGSIVWQVTLSDFYVTAFSVKLDSSGNIYVCGFSLISGLGYQALITKYNSSGVFQWARTIGNNSGLPDIASSVDIDSSGNVYIVGSFMPYSPNYDDLFIIKFDSSGNQLWQKSYDDGQRTVGTSIKLDSSNNIYCCGTRNVFGSSNYQAILMKCNSAGAILWQKSLDSAYTDNGQSVILDNAGYVYICGYTTGVTPGTSFIAKYDTSGNLIWQRVLSGASGSGLKSLTFDSSNNIYAVGTGDTANSALLVKYNSSGVLQWQRTLKLSSGNNNSFNAVKIDSNQNVYCVGSQYNGTRYLITLAKVPSNGTQTGGHGEYIYTGSNLTDSAGTMTDGTPAMIEYTTSYQNQTPTMTAATGSFTRTLTYF